MNEYDVNLNKALDIPIGQVEEILPTITNLSSGGLLRDLKITKNNKVVGVRGDWEAMPLSNLSYVSNNVVQSDNGDVYDTIRVGDKVQVTQTTTKYFYVIFKDDSTKNIYLDAGDDYTFTSGAFTYFATSDKVNPEGFPQVFDFSTSMKVWGYDNTPGSWVDISSNFTGGSGLREASYSMNGTVVTVSYNVGTTTLPADIVTVVMTSPFKQRTQSQTNVGTPTYLTAGTVDTGSNAFISMIWGRLTASVFPGDPFTPASLGVVTSPSISVGTEFDSGSFGMRNTFVVAV